MAKLPPMPCWKSLEIEQRLADGRRSEAVDLLAKTLRAGNASPFVQRIAAEILVPDSKSKRPGRKRSELMRWRAIGVAYEEYESAGCSRVRAIEMLVDQFGLSDRHIEKSIKFYKEYMARSALHE